MGGELGDPRKVRFVVVGAGAIGGIVGGKLHEAGDDVTFVARGANLEAIGSRGLTLETPEASSTLNVPVAASPADVAWHGDEIVLLSVKSQDTERALAQLEAAAPPTTPVVCMQNGVENERRVIRVFSNTYGMCVMCPATHLEPGVVQAHSSPVTGILDLGRYPSGVDETAALVAAALGSATFESVPTATIMAWKYRKLIMNLANAVEALCGVDARSSELATLAQVEGEACLEAAGIDVVSVERDAERRRDLIGLAGTRSGPWHGGSSWQSLARKSGEIEADFLNGEIALLGRLYGIDTPVNSLLQRLARDAARSGNAPGSQSVAEILSML